MVELVDTLGSGSSEDSLMQVRVLFRAQSEGLSSGMFLTSGISTQVLRRNLACPAESGIPGTEKKILS